MPLTSGLVGYLGYDIVRRLERLPDTCVDDLHVPELVQLLVADLAVACAALALTPVVKGEFNATIPGFWIAGTMLAWAVRWHTRGGLAASAVLVGLDVAVRGGTVVVTRGGEPTVQVVDPSGSRTGSMTPAVLRS